MATKIKETNDNMDVGKRDPFSLWVGVKTGLDTLEINTEVPQKARSKLTIRPNCCDSRHMMNSFCSYLSS